ncbi:MAG: hypothetical protein R6V02_12020 [Candidatus Aminicenantes bacterium]
MRQEIKKLSIREAEQEDIFYWKSKTPEEKLDALQELREIYYQINKESRKGFQRIYRVIKEK